MRQLLLAGASALALAGCARQPVTYTRYYPPIWTQQAIPPQPQPIPAGPSVRADNPQPDIIANTPDDTDDDAPAPPKAAAHVGHDLTVAAGGYVIGRQAESLVRQTLGRGSLTTAAKQAATVGAGAAVTRAVTGGRALTVLRGGAAAAGALAGGEVVGGALAAGAGEILLGAAIVAGGAYLAYEAYQHYQQYTDHQKKAAQHGQ